MKSKDIEESIAVVLSDIGKVEFSIGMNHFMDLIRLVIKRIEDLEDKLEKEGIPLVK